MKLKFAKRMSYIKASEIREILKVTEREDVISLLVDYLPLSYSP